jgi:hypothetical protein
MCDRKITVLTDPIPTTYQYHSQQIKSRVRPLLRRLDKKDPLKKPLYGGHYAVTRSLIEGLKKARISFVYNPQKVKDCTEEVIVLAGLTTLQQAISLREKGIIKKLAAGPNIVNLPSDRPEVIGSPFIDHYILNSEWIKDIYIDDMPSLAPKIVLWPAGVDEQFWQPQITDKAPCTMLFYSKRPEKNLFAACRNIAENSGFTVTVLDYGRYTPLQYKELLDRNSILVHFVEQETQGISLAEAWSMNVPSLVWNPGTFFMKGMNFTSSSAPCLSNETGLFFQDATKFEEVVKKLTAQPPAFKPREWILRHLTDEISARNLLELIGF